MSQVLINQCLAELGRIKKASDSWRGLMVREVFKDLLKAWGRHDRGRSHDTRQPAWETAEEALA